MIRAAVDAQNFKTAFGVGIVIMGFGKKNVVLGFVVTDGINDNIGLADEIAGYDQFVGESVGGVGIQFEISSGI